ncbi:MAG: hypothetical protein M3151_05300, partial [Actinomycetota bacterium]|nr:hypothetical protein [Actinomycetota bacterium]
MMTRSNFYIAMLAALVLATSVLALVAPAKPAEAAFSGKNGKIVFSSDRTSGEGVDNFEGDYEIFAVNPDGTGLTQLTHNDVIDGDPAYSRTGFKIAFTRTFGTNEEIYVMNADGSNEQQLTDNPAADIQPAFSPDG